MNSKTKQFPWQVIANYPERQLKFRRKLVTKEIPWHIQLTGQCNAPLNRLDLIHSAQQTAVMISSYHLLMWLVNHSKPWYKLSQKSKQLDVNSSSGWLQLALLLMAAFTDVETKNITLKWFKYSWVALFRLRIKSF